MAKAPILSAPKPGEVLIMYLAISSIVTSAVLIQEEGKNHYSIFYTCKTMTDAETRYNKVEKIIQALVHAKRKLRHYFESYNIVVLTNYPMRAILSKLDLSGRITKWAIELSSFDITYEPKVSHKGQTLANFLLEYEDKLEEPELPELHWELRVDGSSNLTSAGAGIIITTLEGTKLQQSIHLNFPATNNKAEYKALLDGLRLANQLQVKCLKVFSDSQLVVNQVIGKYQPKEERMKTYKEAVESATRRFDQIKFHQVPQEENSEADELAIAASSSDEDLVHIVPIDILNELSINPRQEIMVIPDIPREPCWMDPLEAYLKYGTFSNQKAEKKKVRFAATKYFIINNQLYRKIILRSLPEVLKPQ
ncbi:uncharacterized protein LOC132277926 [Cornus florida]|uniref:uncharacterized protein LOC132277926 n=1 Tax=Cornus florida TaxID=4283 RepID=UPI0028A010A9|nr:uncharacterized protein LOC132277926 [Cornus florida]